VTAAAPQAKSPAGELHGAARRVFIDPGASPADALRWSADKPADRQRILGRWRRAISFIIITEPRPLKLAWVLSELFGTRGHAFAGDQHLAEEVQMTKRNVRAGLARLRALGAIEVAWVDSAKGRQERRIYPSAAVIRKATLNGFQDKPKSRPSPGPTPRQIKRRPNAGPKGRPNAGPTESNEPKEGDLLPGNRADSTAPFQQHRRT
jgi:hypothetical protein